MKMRNIQASEGAFTYTNADAMVALADEIGAPYRLHSLIQPNATPDWFLNALTAGNWEAMIGTWISAALAHFTAPRSIDVVVEPLSATGSGNGYASNAFYSAAGIDYVAKSFELARQSAPNASLCLSEGRIEYYTAKRTALYGLLDTIVPAGNIDAVAVQSHLSISNTYDFDAIQTMFETIKGYGLKANITELDVAAQESVSADEYDQRAAELVRNYVGAWKAANCGDELLIWGLSDRHSWLHANNPSYTQRPLPFDADLKTKRMYGALKAALAA